MSERTRLGTLFRPFDDGAPTLTDHARTASTPTARDSRPDVITLPAALPHSEGGEGGARYTVKAVLGRGGMGEVRLCRDDRIGREIAVKVMQPPENVRGAGRDEVRVRFMREARIQAQLEHPAIVPVHEVEVFDDGTAYFTMKRVRGQTLSSVIAALARGDEDAQRRFTRRTLLQAFQTVCLAVDFAHTRGVVHRDLKPQNIMLGDYGEVYVLDWGIAKLLAQPNDDVEVRREPAPDEPVQISGDASSAVASRAGSILGTPGYMAPEQIDPARAAITPATDVYALGAILFELLTFKPVLPASTNELELVVHTLRGVDARACALAPERAVPPELEKLCARALAVDASERFPSARALWSELERFLEGEQDVERRRAQSTAHAKRAEELVLEASADESDPKRVAAYGELSRALALDPDNGAARHALVRLLTAPHAGKVPVEVAERIEAFNNETERLGAWLHAPVIFTWLATVPFALWAGVRDWVPVVAVLGLITVVSVLSAFLGTRKTPIRSLQLLSTVLTFTAYVGLSWIIGPFAIAPALFSMYTVTMQTHPNVFMQRSTIVLAIAAVSLAFLMEYVSGASYRFEGGNMIVMARALELERAPTFLMVGVGTVGALLFTTGFIARVRARLTDAERALGLQAWRLERLVPK